MYSILPNLVLAFHGCDESTAQKVLYNHEALKIPTVIGAVISLGNCLNLTDYKSGDILRVGYDILKYELGLNGKELPINRNVKGNTDLLYRDLDCAVIQRIHQYNRESKKRGFDSVRGVFQG